jgi:tRNA A37 threonylcarbamoyladenosine modification protein TsaB
MRARIPGGLMLKIKIDTTKRHEKEVVLTKVAEDGSSEVLEKVAGEVDIVTSIKEILDKRGLKPEDIADYDYNEGPGSFTGLKIGAAIINALNWATGKRSIKELKYPNYGREPNITLKPDLK